MARNSTLRTTERAAVGVRRCSRSSCTSMCTAVAARRRPPTAARSAALNAELCRWTAIRVSAVLAILVNLIAPRWLRAMPAPTLGARERMAQGACRPMCSARWRRRRRKRRAAAEKAAEQAEQEEAVRSAEIASGTEEGPGPAASRCPHACGLPISDTGCGRGHSSAACDKCARRRSRECASR